MDEISVPHLVAGRAAAIRIENLDTDQIMPKQFLRGIDKAGLADGLLYDLRFDAQGQVRSDFVLNRPQAAGTRMLIAGANFGCGSSREHAVWGLQQYGVRAVIAPSFGEIFYSNAMNNRLLLVMLPQAQVEALMAEADARAKGAEIEIDVAAMRLRSADVDTAFTLSDRHRRMFLEGLDVIGLSLAHQAQIDAFAARHWAAQPWVRDVARKTRERLATWNAAPAPGG
ncbi:3-isopropylmalate dehydratase small subunit [Rhodoferax koreense]|uniref:3-isopropylmalate dehydratase small subunit n=1 Tax=Rhodoferax koreensis TaxID=1842727 RepID=A0A1P8K1A9_9BURK|nr:3-isopropylmalate dehydratase small subunit [Rhodoferax koreense]APW39775.1 3-isopropylmalate dehydratase small subunit [Rhodoferax koreense]